MLFLIRPSLSVLVSVSHLDSPSPPTKLFQAPTVARLARRVTTASYETQGFLAMAAFRIAVIGGDGIGPEVIDEAIRVSDAAVRHDGATISWNRLPWGSTFYKQTGRLLPADGWAILP